jgi:hypothetical protein
MHTHNGFDIQIASSVNEVGITAWDELSSNSPFQSARWYAYGERVMEGCQPLYIILKQDNQPIARGTFWLVHDEPLPVSPQLRTLFYPILHHWPLLICRSPLSNSPGLVLPEPPLRGVALRLIAETAFRELRRLGGSFLIFDYLENDQTKWMGWPSQFTPLVVTGPGTKMTLQSHSFTDYLKSNNKFRIHQHFRRSSQEAADLGIKVTRHNSCDGIPMALELIHNVERRHNSTPNPWATGLLKHMGMVESTWLTAHIGNRLVGCMLLSMDNGVQIASLPGLTDDVPFAYFMLLYEAIQVAFEEKLTALYWGSGAYETKRRLGFELEYNNNIVFQGRGLIFKLVASLV